MTETGTTDETPADRWDVSHLPPEPEPGTAVQATGGRAWVRNPGGGHQRWASGSESVSWERLVMTRGPLVRLVPAVEARDDGPALAQRDELLRTVDSLRNTVARYRGTPAMREAARKVVSATSADERTQAVGVLGRTLDEADRESRAVAEPVPERSVQTSNLRRDVVRAARRVLDKVAPWDEPSDADLGPELNDLRRVVAELDRRLLGKDA